MQAERTSESLSNLQESYQTDMGPTDPHPLLAQVPLTVSPFVNLPTATSLPYTYKTLPSTLARPASFAQGAHGENKPKFVISSTGHAAHPDDIIESCRALQAHLQRMQQDVERVLREWENAIRERELAEKRSLAPGWLDREEKLLEPERMGAGRAGVRADVEMTGPGASSASAAAAAAGQTAQQERDRNMQEGEELDRAFGGLNLR